MKHEAVSPFLIIADTNRPKADKVNFVHVPFL